MTSLPIIPPAIRSTQPPTFNAPAAILWRPGPQLVMTWLPTRRPPDPRTNPKPEKQLKELQEPRREIPDTFLGFCPRSAMNLKYNFATCVRLYNCWRALRARRGKTFIWISRHGSCIIRAARYMHFFYRSAVGLHIARRARRNCFSGLGFVRGSGGLRVGGRVVTNRGQGRHRLAAGTLKARGRVDRMANGMIIDVVTVCGPGRHSLWAGSS